MIDHFSSVADVITRQEYFVAVVDAIQRGERILCGSVSGSPPTHEEGEVIQQILDAIVDAARRGVKMRYLLPLAPDRLQMGKRYKLSGAEVKFHPSLLISDMRYMLVDDRLVLVGVPERKGRNEPTRKGFTIPSESVTHLFKTQFDPSISCLQGTCFTRLSYRGPAPPRVSDVLSPLFSHICQNVSRNRTQD